ncbi:MAG: ABC transporter ATP-binding protein [Clostridia bacterium]|nr:ABC transporter ATP-binding protein [Clostridia bacterium]
MIEVKNLVKRYGDHTAVDHLSFEIEKGKIYGFLGPNGAGKSTTMNMITGYIASTEGTVIIDGHDILEEPEEAKKCIGYLPEMPPLYFDMTVLEYLKFVADLKKIPKDKKASMIEEIMDMVKITDMKNRLIKNLSKGYRQRVGIAQAVLGYPEVIILDEPTVGLDPKQINEIRELIKGLKKKHTVILSSHILSEVSAVCDYVLIISHGKLVASDTPENLGKLATGSNNLNLLVKGQKDTIKAALEGVEGVKEVTVKKSPEEGVYALTVSTEENADVREKVFYSMVNAGCPILEMQSKKVSLEEIFLELTESEKKDKDDSGKKSGKSFFKTAADAENYLNGKNENNENHDDTDNTEKKVLDNGLFETRLADSDEISDTVSGNGLSDEIQDNSTASEEEKGEE